MIDRGVLSGPGHSFPGPNENFVVGGLPFLPAVCEGDFTLALAFANSCIPIYERIARQLGRPAYRQAVRAMDYGNRGVDGAPLDSLWLQGTLAISAAPRFVDRGALLALASARYRRRTA